MKTTVILLHPCVPNGVQIHVEGSASDTPRLSALAIEGARVFWSEQMSGGRHRGSGPDKPGPKLVT